MRQPLTVRHLKVWKKSIDLVETSYRTSAAFPSGERFGLISQIQRAATSVPANISEGYAGMIFVLREKINKRLNTQTGTKKL